MITGGGKMVAATYTYYWVGKVCCVGVWLQTLAGVSGVFRRQV